MRRRIPFRRIDAGEAADLFRRDGVLAFDVRDAVSFETSHIEGAQRLSQADLSSLIATTAKTTPIVIYCYRGHASQEYAQTLSDFGFTEVYSLDGGYEDWNRLPRSKTASSDILRAWLCQHGFPPDGVNAAVAGAVTPLMKAAHLGDQAAIRALLAAEARIEERNADGNNALWFACVGGDPGAIDLLVAAGIDIDNRSGEGTTALMYAASAGKAGVVAQLLARGADTTPETPDGFTAFDFAASVECLALLRHAGRTSASVENIHEHHRT